MKDVIEYVSGTDFINKIFDEYPMGNLKVICSHCREEMLVILDCEDVVKYQRSRGMYCSNGHIQVAYNMNKRR